MLKSGHPDILQRELAGGASQPDALLNSPLSRIRETRVMDSALPT
jgi:hypothetical protein